MLAFLLNDWVRVFQFVVFIAILIWLVWPLITDIRSKKSNKEKEKLQKSEKFTSAFFQLKISPQKNSTNIFIQRHLAVNIIYWNFKDFENGYNSNYDGKGNKKIRILLETEHPMINVEHGVTCLKQKNSSLVIDDSVDIVSECFMKGHRFVILDLKGDIDINNRIYKIILKDNNYDNT